MVTSCSSQSYRKQGEKQKAKPAVSVSQSETSLENEPTLSSLATSAPDVDDTSTQDSQEADIEVCIRCRLFLRGLSFK